MNYEKKLSLQIFILGTIILSVGFYIAYSYNQKIIIQQELENTKYIVKELSDNFGQRLLEKVKTNKTLSAAPIIRNKLIESNSTYGQYSDSKRNEIIKIKNNKWQKIKDENNAFILEFTNNDVAKFLKDQQKRFPKEYGEIFLTNKYGAIIASTSKLTTLAHAHKYWWQGAYQNGEGAVFFDDRGFDDSVDGYVLGIVIPIKEDNKIIGILKANLNIIGSINELLINSQNENIGEFMLIRSNGDIIFDNKNTPLSNRVPNLFYEKILTDDKEPFLFQDSINKQMIGISEIKITSKNSKGFRFGGSLKSIDHKKGNTGESWFIVNYRSIDTILSSLKNYTIAISAIGFLFVIIMAIASIILGKLTAKPLKQLIEQSKKIAKSDFSARIEVTRKDEIGLLGKAFNEMAKELEENTTSIKNLESEINLRMRTEEKYRIVADYAYNMEYWVSNDNKMIYISPSCERITGYNSKEFIQNPELLLEIVHPNDKSSLKNHVHKTSKTGNILSIEFRIITKNNEIRWISHICQTVYNKEGENLGQRGSNKEITERKLAEKELKDNLHELKDRNEDLNAFSHTVAHDLKNPLANIKGFADLLFEEYDTINESEAKKFINAIIKSEKKAQEIIHSLLLFANLRKSEVKTTAINFEKIVENSIELLQPMILKTDAKISFPRTWPCTLGYAPWVEEVLINYLSNAIKYGGTPPVIDIGYDIVKAENKVRFWVSDNGSGISEKNQSLIFKKFERLDQVKTEGYGLGLSIVKRIIEKLGGEVSLKSEMGKGSKFCFTLPLAEEK